jgi:outer membrane protein
MPGRAKLIRRWPPINNITPPFMAYWFAMILMVWMPLAANATDLLQALDLAQKNDPVYLAAEANYQADQQLLGQARAGILPSILATANTAKNDYTSSSGNDEFNSSGYGITLRQPLFNWERFAALKQAGAQVRKAETVFSAAKQELIKRVAVLYFAVLSAGDTLGLAEAERTAIAEQLELAKSRLEVGLGTITEVHDARARYELAVAQVLEAQNALEDQREALREAIGMRATALRTLKKTIPLLLPEPADVQQWINKAKEQNLELLAAKDDVEIARRQLSVTRSGYLPSLDVVGSRTHSDSSSTIAGSNINSTNNSVALELSVPILQGGRVYHESKEARFRYDAALQALEGKFRNVVRVSRSAYLGIESEASRVRALAQAVVASESALDAKKTGYEAGINTNVQVLDAQRDLFSARRDYAQARYNYLLNLLQLKEAAGILSAEDIKQINSWLE